MSNASPVYCVVDDTPLTGNLDEIEPWVQIGSVALVVPLYTLERLHVLKKDASQIGQSARRAVKFLDQITSTPDLPHEPVLIQGPDDLYPSWPAVEAHYSDSSANKGNVGKSAQSKKVSKQQEAIATQLEDLSLESQDFKSSPVSTPPSSPSGSEPQSAKTSPEVKCATVSKQDATPVPPVLKPLINFVVWSKYDSVELRGKELLFLTNSADAAQIAKDFGVTTKTIHQLRATIGTFCKQEPKSDGQKNKKKGSKRKASFKNNAEPKTLFSYDEGSSEEEEELVFQPRARDLQRPTSSGRGAINATTRGRGAAHSPTNSIEAVTPPKPQVPVEEIDPDSFDRGTFARGSIPLANVGNHYGPPPANNVIRGQRGGFPPTGPRGGYRGNGFRGRGRGRLYVP